MPAADAARDREIRARPPLGWSTALPGFDSADPTARYLVRSCAVPGYCGRVAAQISPVQGADRLGGLAGIDPADRVGDGPAGRRIMNGKRTAGIGQTKAAPARIIRSFVRNRPILGPLEIDNRFNVR